MIINLSMLGQRPTGLGVYAAKAASVVFSNFKCSAVCGDYPIPDGIDKIQVSRTISFSSGKLAAIRRLIWLYFLKIPNDALVYSPTHHGLGLRRNQIITIHDLIALRFPAQHIFQYLYFLLYMPLLLKRCVSVFTVSETSKSDINKFYGFPLDKIFVVPNSVDLTRFSKVNGQSDGVNGRPYILMVGARFPHKNVEEVFLNNKVWADRYDLKIVSCVGRYRDKLMQLAKDLKIESKVHFYDYVSDSELVSLYDGASALVYPSKWEGFGIPPLEALAVGIPIVISDIPVHKEIFEDAAFYIQLGNSVSWLNAMAWISEFDKDAAKSLANKRILEKFSEERFRSDLISALKKFA